MSSTLQDKPRLANKGTLESAPSTEVDKPTPSFASPLALIMLTR